MVVAAICLTRSLSVRSSNAFRHIFTLWNRVGIHIVRMIWGWTIFYICLLRMSETGWTFFMNHVGVAAGCSVSAFNPIIRSVKDQMSVCLDPVFVRKGWPLGCVVGGSDPLFVSMQSELECDGWKAGKHSLACQFVRIALMHVWIQSDVG